MHSTISSLLAKAASATSLSNTSTRSDEALNAPSLTNAPSISSSTSSLTSTQLASPGSSGSLLAGLSLAAFKTPTPLAQEITTQAFGSIFERIGPGRLICDNPMYLPNLLSFIAIAPPQSKAFSLTLLQEYFLP